MFKKKCSSCSFALEKRWNFCPNCGFPLNRQGMGPSNINVDLSKMMQQMVGPLLNGLMNGGMFQTQPVQRPVQTNLQEKFAKEMGSINEVAEPEDLVSNNGDTIVHAIGLPGVKSKSDINVTKLENSIEVRALAGKRLYLKIIKREKGEGILSEQFTKENLILVLKKI
ncbi:MAG: zinc ribbon domain-containing protein [Candidatus Parvarchaeota archaeon]|nr:zinc ribbon domain-containing protein [Candidatus Parvarchaeota archaeon]MCL5101364.1 zinc ribbon domain-containing protein [Candidatus Parvarchaeota archaeon]